MQQNARRRLECRCRTQRESKELINDTALRSRSTAQTYTVSLCSVRSQSSGSEALPGSMWSLIRAVNASGKKPRNWHVALRRVAKAGQSWARYAALVASARRWIRSASLCRLSPSARFSITRRIAEGGQPLSGRGGLLVDLISVIAGLDRLHSNRCDAGRSHPPDAARQPRAALRQRLGYLAGVEAGRALAADTTQGFGKRTVAEAVANLRRATAGEIRGASCRDLPRASLFAGPNPRRREVSPACLPRQAGSLAQNL